MPTPRDSLLLAGILFCLLTPLPAQDKAPPPARRIALRLLAIDAQVLHGDVCLRDPAAPAAHPAVRSPVKGYLNHENAVLALYGGSILVTRAPAETGAPAPVEPLATVSIPADVRSAIVLFLPSPRRPGKIDAMVIDDSIKAFPRGSYHTVNWSARAMRVQLESKSFDFKPLQAVEYHRSAGARGQPFRHDGFRHDRRRMAAHRRGPLAASRRQTLAPGLFHQSVHRQSRVARVPRYRRARGQ